MNEKDTSASSYMDGSKSIFLENTANSSFAETDVSSRLYQFESLSYGAHHSPGEGMVVPRSVKEVEESHASLKKENFNLKLRIYFLEERMNTDFNINTDNAVMKNIELKVQVESLRKELTEKQEMLCQAVKTMELDEEDYKKLLAERDKKFFDLEKEYQSLERKYEQDQQERSHGDIILPDPDIYQTFELEANITELENKLTEEHLENVRLKASFDEEVRTRELRISCLQAEVDEKSAIVTDQHKSIVILESDMEKRYLEIKRLKEDRSDDMKQIADMEGSLRESQQSLETAETEYEQENMKVNRMKLSLSQRNKRIMELEDIVRRQKTHIGTLEAQVRQTGGVATPAVSICAERDASFTALSGEPPTSPPSYNNQPQQQQQSPITTTPTTITDNDSSLSLSNTIEQPLTSTLDPAVLEKNLEESRHHILKLERDRRRAGEIIHSMLEKRKELSQEICQLKEAHDDKDQMIAQLKQTIQELKEDGDGNKSDACADGLTVKATATPSSSEINNESNDSIVYETDVKSLCANYQQLANDLDKQKEILLAIIKEKDTQMKQLELNYNIAVTDMKIKDEKITDLERNLHENKPCEKIDIGSEKESSGFWILETEEKDREIDRLEAELKKRNANIQSIVNTELWDKNREIEKVQQLLRSKDKELSKLSREIDLLKTELLKYVSSQIKQSESSTEDVQQKLRSSIEDRKKLLDQIETMYIDNEYPADCNKDYLHLKNEYKQLKDEFDRCEQLRAQTNEICSVLSKRLEELAIFLDSLLKHQSFLGFLGSRKNTKLRQIIDRSLDLSRTLNMNLSQMNPDQSLLQLTNISNFFNASVIDDSSVNSEDDLSDETGLEKNQLITEQAGIISALRQQIETMQAELVLKETSGELSNYDGCVADILFDISKVDPKPVLSPQMILENLMSDKLNIQQNDQLLNTTSTTLKYWQESNSTESESWSEPDRNVSKQRIGLNPTETTKMFNLNNASTSDTNTEQKQTTKLVSKRTLLLLENRQLLEENRDLKEKISTNNDLLIQTETSFCAISEQLKRELNILDTLRIENEELSSLIKDKEEQLNTCELDKISNQNHISELHNVIDELHKQQDDLKRNSDVTTKELNNQINLLELDRIAAANRTITVEEEIHKLKFIIENYEASLKDLYKEKMHLENALRQESELIQKQTEDFRAQVVDLKRQSEEEIKRITETALVMKQKYECEYVKRAELDKMMSSIKELESLQMVLNTTEEKIQLLEDNEARLKGTLQDTHQEYREKLIDMRKKLDSSTLKYSEIMLEKTRQMKEKAALEVQIKEYANKEEDFKRQVADFQQSLNSMKEVFQAQVSNLDNQKSALQLRLNEVETINEELRNTVEKSNNGEPKTINPAPSTPSKFFSLFMGRQSSYTNDSENVRSRQTSAIIGNQSGDQKDIVAVGDDDPPSLVDNGARNNGNTSPDLGIESDQGRFSSLENNNPSARPFYSTLELTQQMQNLLLTDDRTVGERQTKSSGKDVCQNGLCLNVFAENSQLREKLVKTRSALEETVSQLKYANEKKKHVEKTICKQIHKTSQVLRKAKANLDSGSETDLRK